LIAIIILQLFAFEAKYTSQKENEFIVFNKKKNTLITERHGDKVTLYSNDSILKNASDDLALKSYLVANFCETQQKKPLTNLLYFKNKKS